jgi:DNA-binding CsgD family transcriptional regulator
LAIIARNQGNTALAWTLIQEGLPAGREAIPGDIEFFPALILQCLAASLALDVDDFAAAREWLEVHDRWLAWNQSVLGQAEGDLGWATYHRATGDTAAAYASATCALQHATAPRQPLALLAAHRLLGELDTAARRFDDAAAHLADALMLADACAAPYERALTLLAQAELRAASGSRADAMALLDEVRAICTPLGAQPALARADALAASFAAVAAPAPGYPDGMTAREGEVLRLIAAGMSNREMAQRLSVSVRTIERHIENLYRKIGTRSKADATAYAFRHDLT